MHGMCLMLLVATAGVQYGWERNAQGEMEYIIQLEPELLQALADGQEVVSFIHPDVQNVRRFRVRVGNGPLPREGKLEARAEQQKSLPGPEHTAQDWANPPRILPSEVVRGQLDADSLPALARPEFNELAQLTPRYGTQPSTVQPAQGTSAIGNPRYAEPAASSGQSATPGNPVYSGAPLTSWNPSFFATAAQPTAGSTGAASGYNPVYSSQGNSTDTGWSTQGSQPTATTQGGYSTTQTPTTNYGTANTGSYGTASQPAAAPTSTYGSQQPTNYATGSTATQPYAATTTPNYGTATQPYSTTPLGGQTPNYTQPGATPPSYTPTYPQNNFAGASSNQSPTASQSGYLQSSYPQPNLQPPANSPPAATGQGNWPLAESRPPATTAPNWQTPAAPTRPVYTAFAPENNSSAQPSGYSSQQPGAAAPTAPAAQPVLVSSTPAPSRSTQEMNPEDRPWGPLTFALLLLFASLGGNFYLSWLAWDFYIRFRTLLVETSSTSAA